jgi:tRNA(His) 5'-end guanylyltransferase
MSGGNDDIGDRMKAYEAVETERVLDARRPVYARIDGRAFSGLTRGMNRPFDPRMTIAMVGTASHLVRETQARIGYTQSDEINLVWLYEGEQEPLFGNKVHKLTSILASLAGAVFQNELRLAFDIDAAPLLAAYPHFDARVMHLPNKDEAANAILWRTLDARKNAVSMAARAAFPAKALHGKDQAEMRTMLTAASIDFDSYPKSFRLGTFLQRVARERPFAPEELERIPAEHRPPPGTLVTHVAVEVIDMPDFITVANRVAVIFDGQRPDSQGS